MNTITLTSKGQVTLPVELRRNLNIKEGDKLEVKFNQATQSITLSKPMTIDELSARATSYIKKGAKPVLDANAYWQSYREETE